MDRSIPYSINSKTQSRISSKARPAAKGVQHQNNHHTAFSAKILIQHSRSRPIANRCPYSIIIQKSTAGKHSLKKYRLNKASTTQVRKAANRSYGTNALHWLTKQQTGKQPRRQTGKQPKPQKGNQAIRANTKQIKQQTGQTTSIGKMAPIGNIAQTAYRADIQLLVVILYDSILSLITKIKHKQFMICVPIRDVDDFVELWILMISIIRVVTLRAFAQNICKINRNTLYTILFSSFCKIKL